LYEKPKYGDARPVVIDGAAVSTEMVALNAGNARYRYWRDITEYWQDVKIQDIRVRSLAKRKAAPMVDGWQARLETANFIVKVIASCGRHFFSENSDRRELVANPFIAYFAVDKVGELWFVDRYTRKPVLVRHHEWRGFSDGGTLRCIVQHLAEHIREDKPVKIGYFSPSPKWVCDGDHWGYGEDMPKVRDAVAQILSGAGECNMEATA